MKNINCLMHQSKIFILFLNFCNTWCIAKPIICQLKFHTLNPLSNNSSMIWLFVTININIYFGLYVFIPTESDMRHRPSGWPLPRPKAVHHMIEDFLTEWDGPISHSQPLRRFLEHCLHTDLRAFYAGSYRTIDTLLISMFTFTRTHWMPLTKLYIKC